MTKNKVNYKKLGKLAAMLSIGGVLLFASCDKTENECNDPYDPSCANFNPKLAQIDALRADNTRLAGEVRAAVEPAKSIPYDISKAFDNNFRKTSNELQLQVKNIVDSAKVFIPLGDEMIRNHEEYANPENMIKLQTKSGELILASEALAKIR